MYKRFWQRTRQLLRDLFVPRPLTEVTETYDWTADMIPGVAGCREGDRIVSTDTKGYVFYGPYRHLLPGKYIFTIDIDCVPDPKAVNDLHLDIAIDQQIRCHKTVVPREKSISIPIELEVQEADASKAIEVRLHTTGRVLSELKSILVQRLDVATAVRVAPPKEIEPSGEQHTSVPSVEVVPIKETERVLEQHPVFSVFEPFSGSVPLGFDVDYVGTRTRSEFLPYEVKRSTEQVIGVLPPFDEEYFEWIDVLESVTNARNHYTMIELGAGYGRWAVRSALACRQKGLSFTLGLAEAEPKHLEWLRQHLADNDIPLGYTHIYEAAISDADGTAYFYVGMPDDFNDDTARKWYGQSLAHNYEKPAGELGQEYSARKVIEMQSKWKAVEVQKMHIDHVLKDYSHIDLLDMDVQGEESKIVAVAIHTLNTKVKRVHIGTHGREIEAGLRNVFHEHGWRCIHDFPCHSTTITPYGYIKFCDGVQSWINPHFL